MPDSASRPELLNRQRWSWSQGPLLARLLRSFGRRIDHLAHLGDLAGREPADFGGLTDDRLIFGQIDAKGLVGRNVAFDPLNVGAKLLERLVGLRGCSAQLVALERADLRNVPLDDKFSERHRSSE